MSVTKTSASSFVRVVISTLPSVIALNELMPTLMSVGFILDLSIPCTDIAESLSLDLTVILKCCCCVLFPMAAD